MSTIPLVMGTQGPILTSTVNIRSNLTNNVESTNPGYTNNLPGTLIEDIASTDVAAIAQIDQARIDAVNSVTPYGANSFVLAQLGAQFGIPQGGESNTSVYVTISGPAGYFIPRGFLVSDGAHDYSIQDGGTITTGGDTQPLYAVAIDQGAWAVVSNTVTTLKTSVPSEYTLTCTNALAGLPGGDSESVQNYRARVLQAQTITCQGTASYLFTELQKIAGVQSRLTTILQASGGWEIICGGGDPYAVAGAIYNGTLDLLTIVGSETTARNVTVTVIDSPDTYDIVYVYPPMQTVTVAAHWNTTLTSFTGALQVNNLGAPAIKNYINSIKVGQPINILELNAVFQNAVAVALTPDYLTTLTFVVNINGSLASVSAGTDIILSDPESYFYCEQTGVTVERG